MKFVPHSTALALAALLATSGVSLAQSAQGLQDAQIETRVQAALARPAYSGSAIRSTVSNGVVTLSGNVGSQAEKERASQDLVGIDGVRTVLNNLAVLKDGIVVPVYTPVGATVTTLPAGTAITVRLSTEIDTKHAKPGDSFRATTSGEIQSNGVTVLPTGTPVTGLVVESKNGGRLSGSASLTLQLVGVRLAGANGPQEITLATDPLSSQSAGKGGNTALRTGGGAALGAIVGAVAGGGTGAVIGAAGGGAVGAGASGITPGRQIDLKPEQMLQFKTSAPLDVPLRRPGAEAGTVSLQPRATPQ